MLKDIIHSRFIKVFNLQEKSDELLEKFFDKPILDLGNSFIMKGNIGIKFDNLKKMIEEENIVEKELSDYYDDLFKLKLVIVDIYLIMMLHMEHLIN